MVLDRLPSDVVQQCQDLPINELERMQDEQLKREILTKHREKVADLQDLPANEFVKRYLARQLKW